METWVQERVRPSFGTLLRRYRVAAGLTQEELAERACLSRRSITALERGTAHTPRRDTLELLAEALALAAHERVVFLEAGRRRGMDGPGGQREPAGAAVAPPFVGRASELALVERHLAGEGPPVLLLAGEPGIGKSRLLHAGIPRAVAQGWRVLVGSCTRADGQQPFAPLLQALQRHLSGRSAAERRSDLRRCAWLIRLLPELPPEEIEPLPAWTLTADQERRLMFGAVDRFVANVAGPAGTLLVLDDLQWVGVDVLDLLATLLRSAPTLPLRVVGAYRSTDVVPAAPLSRLLIELAEAGLVVHQALGPLADAEAEELLRALLDGTITDSSLLEQVVRRVGGVPFFLVSYARAQAGDNPAQAMRDLPWDLRQSLRGRISMLSASARGVLGVAAVAGRVVPWSILLAAAAQPEESVLLAVEEACHAGLLEEVGVDAYGFVHDVIREVAEGELGLAWRRVLHRRVALALAARAGDPPVEALAHHFQQSGEREQAAVYLEQAGDRAASRYAYTAAEAWYRDLAACLDDLGHSEAAARAREKLGGVLFLLARYNQALAELNQAALSYLVAGDLEGRARVMARIGHVHAAHGTPREGVCRLQPLLESDAVTKPSPALAALYVAVAHLYYESGRFAEQLAAGEQAIALLQSLEDDRLLAAALGQRGLALANLGRFEEGLRALAETIRLAEAVGDLENLCQALAHTGNLYLRAGDSARGRPYFERALAVAEQLGDPALIILMLHFHGWFNSWTGDWRAARRYLERAMGLSRQIGSSSAAARSLLQLGNLCSDEGEWEEASRHVEDAVSMLEGNANRQVLQWAAELLARQDLLAGHAATARDRLLQVYASPDSAEEALSTTLAESYLDLGEVSRAQELAARAVARSRARGDRLDLVSALRVSARVAIQQQDRKAAMAILDEGLTLARSTPGPYAEGRFLHLYGGLHAQYGESAQAQAPLQEALAIFRRLGAGKDIERTEQLLATLG